jgi:hypothetical protein
LATDETAEFQADVSKALSSIDGQIAQYIPAAPGRQTEIAENTNHTQHTEQDEGHKNFTEHHFALWTQNELQKSSKLILP